MQQNVDFYIKINILLIIIKHLCLKSICRQGTTLVLYLTCEKHYIFSEVIFGINEDFKVFKNGCRVTHVFKHKKFSRAVYFKNQIVPVQVQIQFVYT